MRDVILWRKNVFRNHCKSDTESVVPSSVPADEMIEEFLIRTRRILVIGDIDDALSTYVCSCLQLLSVEKEPIYMYINSPGGCLASGYAIIDQMSACNCPIFTIVRGQAFSMGAIITVFGDKGFRYSTPNSSLMLHSPLVQGPAEPIEQYNKMGKYMNEDWTKKVGEIAKRLKISKKQLIELMDNTKWMLPFEAEKVGIIDGIWTPKLEQSINGK